jgi:hypothetical protein
MQQLYLTRKEAAAYLTDELGLHTSWRTLQKMATVGGGPPYRVFGIRSIYTHEDLKVWAEAKLSAPRRSTSEAA